MMDHQTPGNKKSSVLSKEPTYIIIGNNGSSLVEQIFTDLGWKKQTDKNSDSFRLKWVENRSSINYDVFREGEQMVNRIPNCYLLTNKLGLLTSLQRYERIWTMLNLGRILKLNTSDFIPDTYRLDDSTDRRIFYEIFKTSDIWICKPTGMNQGRGIYLVRDLDEFKKTVEERELDRKQQKPLVDRIVQRYITNPLLIDGKKFDIRAFMLIASTSPFLVLFHKGYVRLSLQTYSNQTEDLVAHLTNQFVQKRDATYEVFKEDTVWSIEKFNNYFNRKIAPLKGMDNDWVLNTLTNRMKQISLYCFHAVKHKLKCKVGYFDLYGLDFLVDENMKVWLIEINANPCLATNCETLKEVIPSLLRESLYLAVECFEKSRRGLPLYPLHTLRSFQILFNGGHSSAYTDTSHHSLKRSRSSVSPALRSVYQDGADGGAGKTDKSTIGRNYTTSVVFDPHDDHSVASSPVSMFDIKNIEYRKLLVYRSDFTSMISGLPKSLPSLVPSKSPNNPHSKSEHCCARTRTPDSLMDTKSEVTNPVGKDCSIISDGKFAGSRTAVDESSKHRTSGKLNKDKESFPNSYAVNASGSSEKSKNDHAETDKSRVKLSSPENSNSNQFSSREGKSVHKKLSSTKVTSAKSENNSPAKTVLHRPTIDSPIADTSPVSSVKISTRQHPTTEKLGELHPAVEKQTKDLKNSEEVNASVPLSQVFAMNHAVLSQSKATIVSDKFNHSDVAWNRTKSILNQQFQNSNALKNQSTRSLHDFSGRESNSNLHHQTTAVAGRMQANGVPESKALGDKPVRRPLPNEYSYPRMAVNAFMKPIQLLPSSNSQHDKRNGSLDMFMEQLEKDMAKTKFHQSISFANNNRPNDANVKSALLPSRFSIVNQEFMYYDASGSSDQRFSRPEYRFYADKSRYPQSKFYPRVTLNFPPKKEDNKVYLSPQVFSAYSISNSPYSMYHQYFPNPSDGSRNSSNNQKHESYAESQNKRPSESSDYKAGIIGNDASDSVSHGTTLHKPPGDRFTKLAVDNRHGEVKDELQRKERTVNPLCEAISLTADSKSRTWKKKVSNAYNSELQDFRDTFPVSRWHVHDFSHVSMQGGKRVFPEPDLWTAEFHNAGTLSSLSDNLVAPFKAQNNSDKDWGHFTVVSPK